MAELRMYHVFLSFCTLAFSPSSTMTFQSQRPESGDELFLRWINTLSKIYFKVNYITKQAERCTVLKFVVTPPPPGPEAKVENQWV